MQYLASLSQHDGDAAPGMLGSMEEAPRGTKAQAVTPVPPHPFMRMVQMPQTSSQDIGQKSTSPRLARKQIFSKALKGSCG